MAKPFQLVMNFLRPESSEGEARELLRQSKRDLKTIPNMYALMANAPEVYIRYDPQAVLKGKIYFQEIRLNLQELYVLKNSQGFLNLHALKALKRKPKEGEKPSLERRWRIDLLDLKLGKVVYKDYTRPGPMIKEFEVNIREKFDNIDPKSLVRIVVWKALTKTAIAKLINFDLADLENMIKSTLTEAPVAVPQRILEETSNTIKKAAGGISDLIKKPFEKNEKKSP